MSKGTGSRWRGDFFPEHTWFHRLHSFRFLFGGKVSLKREKIHINKYLIVIYVQISGFFFFFWSKWVVLSSNHSASTSSQLPILDSFTFWKVLYFILFSPFFLLTCLSCGRHFFLLSCSFVPSFISAVGVWGVAPGIGVTRRLPLGPDRSSGWGWRQVTEPFPPSIPLSSKPVLYVTVPLEV